MLNMAERTSGIPVMRKTSQSDSKHGSISTTSPRQQKCAPPSPLTSVPRPNTPVMQSEHQEMDQKEMSEPSFQETEKTQSTTVQEKPQSSPVQEKQVSSSESLPEKKSRMEKKENKNSIKPESAAEEEDSVIAQWSETLVYYGILLILTAASVATRLFNIEIPAHVCWDETHFGKMGSWYIKQTFFFDVHPPLGKMLIGLSGYLTGYDGEFPFNKPGDDYGETNYVGMRMVDYCIGLFVWGWVFVPTDFWEWLDQSASNFNTIFIISKFCGLLGAAVVPLVYMSTWLLCRSITAALFSAAFVLFDTGTLTLSRHILLDPILMFFIMCSTYTLLKFLSYRERSFSLGWWFWLISTGIFLACSLGVKFVGLFIIMFAGIATVSDLWRLLGDHRLPMGAVIKHFAARAFCLIVIPLLCYMLIFAAHFEVLSQTGSGDGFYSSQFQSQLEGNRLHNISMPESVAYGSVISLKQRRTGGAYLHSHWHLYPEEAGPRQQQVTSYSHKDENNMWMFKPAMEDPDTEGEPLFVKNGDLVRLEHIVTRRNLHSHREPAPVTYRHFQLSGYGQDGQGDANDVWVVEAPGIAEGEPIKAVRTKLKLIHYHVRCAVYSHDKKLPKWGYDQLEATCNPHVKDPKTLWTVEEVRDNRLPNVSFEVYSPSFLEKFMESHAVMTQGNSGLKPKEGEVTSQPWQWPLNIRGQIFSGKNHRIYLLGNPVIFWSCLGCMALFIGLYTIHALRRQRGVKMSPPLLSYCNQMLGACWWVLIGWGLHYLPFWSMTRVLYFHHYFPAFLFSAMLSGIILDYTIKRVCLLLPTALSITLFHWCVGCVLSGAAYSFYLFHPLSFGMSGTHAHEETSMMYGLKWVDSWEF